MVVMVEAQWPESTFRVKVRLKKTQGQMLSDFSEAVIAKRAEGDRDIIARDPNFKVEAGKFYITANGERVGPIILAIGEMWFRASDDERGRLWNSNGLRLMRDDAIGDFIALAADQTSPM